MTVWSSPAQADAHAAIIGAYGKNLGSSPLSGKAYIFTRNEQNVWTQETSFSASDVEENDNFGQAVAISVSLLVLRPPAFSWFLFQRRTTVM